MRTWWRILLGLCFASTMVRAAEPSLRSDTNELRFVTYNVLADEDPSGQRVPKLLKILRDTDADIIVLLEVAPWFASLLLKEPWVQSYHRPLKDGKPFIAHEYLVLSRFPVSTQNSPLPGNQHRVYFAATLQLPTGAAKVATCHLESLLEDGPIRAQQLDLYFQRLGGTDDAFFAGDFNFGDGEQPDTKHLAPDFRDAWHEVHPKLPGYTWDTEKSRMAREESFPGEPSRRLDRVLFRSSHWTPIRSELLGTEPVSPKSKRLFPSDHFGLLVVFSRSTVSAISVDQRSSAVPLLSARPAPVSR
jgi:endonuclease/exonuclease/phosphatase family metal-dependent hydrolase